MKRHRLLLAVLLVSGLAVTVAAVTVPKVMGRGELGPASKVTCANIHAQWLPRVPRAS